METYVDKDFNIYSCLAVQSRTILVAKLKLQSIL